MIFYFSLFHVCGFYKLSNNKTKQKRMEIYNIFVIIKNILNATYFKNINSRKKELVHLNSFVMLNSMVVILLSLISKIRIKKINKIARQSPIKNRSILGFYSFYFSLY